MSATLDSVGTMLMQDNGTFLVTIPGAVGHEPWLSAWYKNKCQTIKGWGATRVVKSYEEARALLEHAAATWKRKGT